MSKIKNLFIAVLMILASPLAAAVVIDFEDLSTGTIVNNQYQSLGVVFSSPPALNTPTIGTASGHSTTGKVLQDYSRNGGNGSEPFQIIADFLTPISSISVTAYANPQLLLEMVAYDSADVMLGSVSSAGGTFNQGDISLSGIGAISSVVWMTSSEFVGAPIIDNLTFTTAVPEPGILSLLVIGLLGIGSMQRKRNI